MAFLLLINTFYAYLSKIKNKNVTIILILVNVLWKLFLVLVSFLNFPVVIIQVAVKGLPIQEVIHDILKGNWDHERTKFSLPPLMTLVSM